MKYIRQFENLNQNDELTKLKSHLVSIIKKVGYEEQNYIDRNSWVLEFYKKVLSDATYSFHIVLIIDATNRSKFINMSVIRTSVLKDDFSEYFQEYLKTIEGLNLKSEELRRIEFKMNIKDVDKIINQITINDLELKRPAVKYNL